MAGLINGLVLLLIVLLTTACNSPSDLLEFEDTLSPTIQTHQSYTQVPVNQSIATPPVSTAVTEEINVGIIDLSTQLVRDCEGRDPNSRGPQVDEPAIEFILLDVEGNEYVLSDLLAEKPVILIFGSFT